MAANLLKTGITRWPLTDLGGVAGAESTDYYLCNLPRMVFESERANSIACADSIMPTVCLIND
jgi:hypothetical protein